jgi:hypothetical protein
VGAIAARDEGETEKGKGIFETVDKLTKLDDIPY